MSTNNHQPQSQNGDSNPENTTIQSTDNNSSNLQQPIQSNDNEVINEPATDPEPATEVINDEKQIELKENEQVKREEAGRTFTMRELLNELKNGDGDQESEVSATDAVAVTPRYGLGFF